MSFNISEEQYNKLVEDMQEVVHENMKHSSAMEELHHTPGLPPYYRTKIWVGFESLMNKATDNQMKDVMYGLSAEVIEKLEVFLDGFKALEKQIEIDYEQYDIIYALNEIIDQYLNDILRSKGIKVDFHD